MIHMQNYGNVGATVADIDDTVGHDLEPLLQLLEDRDFAVAGGDARNRAHCTGVRVVVELGTVDVIGGNDARQRRNDDFTGSRGDDIKREAVPVEPFLEKVHERRQSGFQTHPTPGLDQVLTADAAKVRIMTDEIGELAALLHEVAAAKACDLTLEIVYAEQLGQNVAGVVEAQCLIEIRHDEVVFG